MTTATPEKVRAAVCEVLAAIAPEFDAAALRPAEPLREQIDLDSFDFLNVLIALNERLGIEVPEKDYPQVQTLDGMIRYFGARATT